MSFWRRLAYLLPAFRQAEEREMREELDSLAAMANPGELGNLTLAAERRREAWGWTWLEECVRDAQYAIRTLRKSPIFAATAVISLGLGIGVNTTIFTLIDALLLRWLPVDHPQELVQVILRTPASSSPRENFSYPLVRALAEQKEVFAAAAGFSSARFSVGSPGSLKRVPGAWVSGAFYETLGLPPVAGRLLTPQDDEPGSPVVAVLSYQYWQREFKGNVETIGQKILIHGYPVTIAGVSPPGFTGADVGAVANVTLPLAAMVPMNINGGGLLGAGNYWLRMLGRPQKGVSVAIAQSRLAAEWPQISKAAVSPGWPRWLQDQIRGARPDLKAGGTGWTFLRTKFEKPLRVLMTMVAVILLICCANVANLLLARGTARQHEIGIRLAIGAKPGRVVRQLLTESILISLLGAAFGLGLAVFGSRALLAVIASGPLKVVFDLTPNANVLAFTAGISVASAILFGLAPALQTVGSSAQVVAFRSAPRLGRSPLRVLSLLVTIQVALSLVLVTGAGLFVRTLRNLQALDPGFQREGVLVAGLNEQRSPNRPPQLTAFFKDAVNRVQQIPGVVSASISGNTPMSGGTWTEAAVPKGQPVPDHDNADFIAVGPRFFETMRTPLLSGREFTDQDDAGAPLVAIVNETFVRKYFQGGNPVGSYISATVSRPPSDLRIVGVVKDVILDDLRMAPPPTVYISYFQGSELGPTVVNIRVSGNFAEAERAIRAEIAPRLPKIPLDVHALSEQVEGTLMQERMMAALATSFGMLALVLACVGLYGLLAFEVTRRRKEIGIRFALGARRSQVLAGIIRGAGRLLVMGAALGVPAAWAASRLVSSMLFGVTPTDPGTFAGACGLLVFTGFVAAFLPAYRASRVDPMQTLRNE
jgi:predicted permease